MVDEDVKRWQKWVDGEHFPWDAGNYVDDEKTVFRKKINYSKKE